MKLSPSKNRILLAVAATLPLIALASLLMTSTAAGAPVLSISPITWNVIGLDSNDVSAGPNNFPVGVRVCNSGPDPATNVLAAFSWDDGGNLYTGDPYINLRSGSYSSIAASSIGAGSVGSPTCKDFYFEVTVTRNASAYDHVRRYRVMVTADGGITLTTPVPRELYVERLISQSRNSTTNLLLDGVSIPAGGTMALVVGNTYTIRLEAATATNGYEQIENFINFPNTIFRVNSVSTTYSAIDSISPDPAAGSKLYADGCSWENDPNSPNYRSCLDTGKYGGTVTVDYNVTIIGGGGTDQTLNSLIYDFSGSSYHYNADFSLGARIAAIIDPTSVDIEKAFSPTTTQVGGISTLSFTINNPNGASLSGLHFTDTFPTTPGAMVTSGTSYTTSGCGSPALRAPIGGGSYLSGQPSVSVSNISVAANSVCTISIQVTAPSTGTYNNTTSNLFIGTADTLDNASASLVMNTAPAPPACTPGIVLASWDFSTSLSPTYVNPRVTSATATHQGGLVSTVPDVQNGQTGWSLTSANPNYWPETASGGYPNNGTAPYFQFEVSATAGDFTGIQMRFDVDVEGNWANANNNHIYVWTNHNGGSYDASPQLDLTPISKTNWYLNNVAAASWTTNSTSIGFRINELGAKTTGTMPRIVLDNVIITGCGIPDPPTISKTFSPDPVAVGGTSNLSFTISNPNPYAALNGIAFNDTLPSGVTVPTTGPVATCGGSLSTTAPGTIHFSGGSLAAGANCTLTGITVTATAAGSHLNLSGNISATNSGTNYGPGGTASDSLTALLPPQIEKLFSPNPIVINGISTLAFTISNPNPDHALSGIAFTDLLPAGVTVSGSAITPQCNGGTVSVTNVGGRDQVALSGGSIPAGGSCTVTVGTTSTAIGSYANTSGSVTALINGVPVGTDTAADTLVVYAGNPGIALLKQVSSNGSDPWRSFIAVPAGNPVYYRFTVENTGDVTLSSVSVSDPTLNPTAPHTLSGCSWASIPSYETRTCTFGPVPAVSGSHPNTATVQGTYSAAAYSDSSTARYATSGLTIVKSVSESYFVAAGSTLHYSFTVTNSGAAPLRGPVTVADDKAADETCPAVSAATQTSPPGPGDGDDWLDPGETITCTATYITVGGDIGTGSVTNTASASADGVTSPTDSETVYLAALTIDKDTSTPTSAAGGTATYSIAIANTGGVPLTGVVISDSLPAGFTYASTGSITPTGAGTTRTSTSNPTVGDAAPTWGAWTIDAGGSVTLTFTANIGSGVTAGTYDNTASVNSSEVPGPIDDDGTAAQDPGTPSGQDPEDDEDVTVVSTGAITIVKDAAPDDAQDFDYTGTGPSGYDFGGGFSLDDDTDGTLPNTRSFLNLAPGSYTLTEAAVGGWSLTNLACVDPDSGSSVDLGTRTASLDLDAGETVTCTFTNTRLGTITVIKDAVPDAAQDFTYSGSGPSGYDFGGGFSLDDDADATLPNTRSFNNVLPGSYSLTESAASGWSLTGLNCLDPDGGSSTSIPARTATLDLDPGESLTCTFTNTLIAAPTVLKTFSPDSISVGGISTLTVTITNPNDGTSLTGVAYTDALPSGVAVAGTPNAGTTNCGTPIWTPASGDTTLDFSGGTIPASGTCTVEVDVTSSTPGTVTNTTSVVTSSEAPNSATASDDLTVTAVAPTVAKNFSPNTISPGGTSTLTITLGNANGVTATLTAALVDTLPANVAVASTPNVGGTCTGTVTAFAGASTITYASGATIPSGGCTITVDVTSSTAGSHTNTIDAGDLQTNLGSNPAQASDDLVVSTLTPPTIAKNFTPDTIDEGGTSLLTLTLSNPNGIDLTGVSLTDTYPGGVVNAPTPNPGTTCGSGTASATAGSGTVGLSGGTIPAGGSCTITVTVAAADPGTYDNTISIGDLTTTQGVSNTASATGTLMVNDILPDISVSKSANPLTVPETGGNVTFTIVVTNNAAETATLTDLSDDQFGDLNGQGSCATGGTIAASGGSYSCSFTGAVPAGDASGSGHTNVVTAGAADNNGNIDSDFDSATVTYTDVAPSVVVTKSASPTSVVDPGGLVTFSVDVRNTSGETLTLTSLVDDVHMNLNGQGTCATGGSIAPGGTYSCSFTASVTGSAGSSEIDTVTAVVTDNEGTTGSHFDSATVIITAPTAIDVSLDKGVSDASPYAGDTVTFTLLIANAGPATATNVDVTDVVPSGYGYVPGSIAGGDSRNAADPGGSGLTWTINSLGAGSSASLTYQALVLASGIYDNYAEITDHDQTDSDSTPGNGPQIPDEDDDDTQVMSVTVVVDPALTKTGDPTTAQVGDFVTFTLQVFNNGSGNATGVVVTDDLPAFLDYVSVIASGSSSAGYDSVLHRVTVTYATVTPSDLFTITIRTQVNSLGAPPGGTNNASLTSASVDADPNNNAGSAPISIFTIAGLASPATGFAPDRVTRIPAQDLRTSYEAYGGIALSIPALGLDTQIVGVPLGANGWDVTWLWDQVGYLAGTAFPGWDGNSILTGHVYLPNGLPGPFVGLSRLRWGDRVIIESFGTTYIYEVRESRLYRPDDGRIIRHEETPWLTLITCQGYDERSDTYRWRRVVRAVLIDVSAATALP
ncbi:MAG: sortase domain-bontaining protein [Anaerolineales bacterium]